MGSSLSSFHRNKLANYLESFTAGYRRSVSTLELRGIIRDAKPHYEFLRDHPSSCCGDNEPAELVKQYMYYETLLDTISIVRLPPTGTSNFL